MENTIRTDELYHYGRKGMKWYQNIFTKGKNKGGSKSDQEDETPEQKKERILKSRSARALYDNADMFTTNELNNAYQRLVLEQNIRNLAPAEVSRGQKFVNKFNSSGKNVHDVFETSSKLYNDAAKLYNTFLKGDGDPLPLIKDNDKKSADNKPKDNKSKESKPDNSKSDKTKSADSDKSKSSDNPADTSDKKVHTGTVQGEGTSKRKEKSSPVVDVDLSDVTVSEVSRSSTTLMGSSYVDNLLGYTEKRDDD